ncbi:MAG: fatty acid desaturase [Myxococcales bacterium]|nr:fatty acid desaturase [Myxococcales bacterium]
MNTATYRHVQTENPHNARPRTIRQAHPEVTALYGRNKWTAVILVGAVAAQIGTATIASLLVLPWWAILMLAWAVGAFATHALFATIHEACHRLIFKDRVANKVMMLIANLPMLVPVAIPLGHYHLVHHKRQGQEGLDPDLPAPWEVRVFNRSRFGKFLWHLAFPFVQPWRLAADPNDRLPLSNPWLLLNAAVQVLTVIGVVVMLGLPGFAYLAASTYFVFALHPLSGRFIQEHFTKDEEETASYYGPLNSISLNFGYHIEHHDFPAVPWNRLPALRRSAIEHYPARPVYQSWARLWLGWLSGKWEISDRVARPAAMIDRTGPERDPNGTKLRLGQTLDS